VTPLDYEFLRKLLKERSGLDLSSDKQYLVESRLSPLARRVGLSSIAELVAKIKSGTEALTSEVVEAMTTNETFFFRDRIPFDHLRQTVLPGLVQARANRRALRIWCAASSTGQEPYSIAMCIKEFAPLARWRVEIVATDLSHGVLEKSRAGIFSQFEVQRGLPIQMLVKYFTQSGDLWQINADIRAMVQHRQLNLLGFFPSRFVRRDFLPQRPDLFRPGDQNCHLRSACKGARARRRAGAGGCRIRGRDIGRLQARSGAAGTLPPERRSNRPRRCRGDDAFGIEGGCGGSALSGAYNNRDVLPVCRERFIRWLWLMKARVE
jgi:chemotaxis methyl-accepting protein methylase